MDTITLFGPALATLVAGFLIGRHAVSKTTLAEISAYAQWAVNAAEELHGSEPGSGAQKLDHAIQAVVGKFGITEKDAEIVVLSVVRALRGAGYLGPKHGLAANTSQHPELN